MIFREKVLSSEYKYKGGLINVREEQVTVLNGQSSREIVEHADGAVMIALFPDGNVVMERQYRRPFDQVVFEAPAGKIDPGEEPLTAAIRELREETGYRAEKMEFLTRSWPSVGYSEETLHIFLATGLTLGATDLDENECIDLELHHIDDLYEMCLAGNLPDAKTQVGILMVKAKIERGELDSYLTYRK